LNVFEVVLEQEVVLDVGSSIVMKAII